MNIKHNNHNKMKTETIWHAAAGMLRHAKATPPTARRGRFDFQSRHLMLGRVDASIALPSRNRCLVVTLLLMLLTTATAWAETETVSYIDADGKTQTVTATVLEGGGATTLATGWYVAKGTVSYTGKVSLGSGDINLILADGATMNVGSDGEGRIPDNGIGEDYAALTIYGQTLGTGALNVYCKGNTHNGIYVSALTINGGTVTADVDGTSADALFASNDVTINGGTVSATASLTFGIFGGDNVEINGGTVSARGYTNGIAGTYVTINGGTVSASGTGTAIIPDHGYIIPIQGISTLNGNVTITGGTVTATGDNYGINGGDKNYGDFGNVTISGGTVNVTGGTKGINALATNTGGTIIIDGGIVTVNGGINADGTITLSGGIVKASSYEGTVILDGCDYRNADGSETITSGGDIANGVYNGKTIYPDIPVSYIDEYGDPQTVESEDYTILEGDPYGIHDLADGTYVVCSNITYTDPVNLDDDVTLILTDGCTMNIGTREKPIYYGKGINGYDEISGTWYDLTIYGQTLGTGTLSVYTSGEYNDGICAGVININGGRITAKTYGQNADAINAISEVTINGGTVSATANVTESSGIRSQESYIIINEGTVTASGKAYGIQAYEKVEIYGGNVTATGSIYGICAGTGMNIILGWTDYDDRIYASSYHGNYIQIINPFATIETTPALIVNGDDNYLETPEAINGKTLRPAYDIRLQDNDDNDAAITADYHDGVPQFVTLQGRTLWKDGAWNTLCLPFALTAEQVTTQLAPTALKELDVNGYYDGNTRYDSPAEGRKQTGLDGTTLYLYFKAATSIEAGKPYLIKWNGDGSSNMVNPVFNGVTIDATHRAVTSTDGTVSFKGTYSPIVWETEDQSILLLGVGQNSQNQDVSTLYYPKPSGGQNPGINAFRAYFQITDGTLAREFKLNFGDGEATGITTTDFTDYTDSAGAWYTLDGRKLDKQPTQKGVYIHGGRKVVIK